MDSGKGMNNGMKEGVGKLKCEGWRKGRKCLTMLRTLFPTMFPNYPSKTEGATK